MSYSRERASERRDGAGVGLEAQQALVEAEQSHRKSADQLEAVTTTLAKHSEDRAREQQLLRRADGVVAFARWRAAANASESAHQRREEASALREKARQLQE